MYYYARIRYEGKTILFKSFDTENEGKKWLEKHEQYTDMVRDYQLFKCGYKWQKIADYRC